MALRIKSILNTTKIVFFFFKMSLIVHILLLIRDAEPFSRLKEKVLSSIKERERKQSFCRLKNSQTLRLGLRSIKMQ